MRALSAKQLSNVCRLVVLAKVAVMTGATPVFSADPPDDTKVPARLIGPTTVITEVTTGLSFPARVDTGATSCSIHCESLQIQDAPSPNPKKNIGKMARFIVRSSDGKSHAVEAKIVDYVTVRTAERDDQRYKVRMRLSCEGVEKKVLVTLNNREKMKYPLLVGRNFLRDDFLVNVNLEMDE
jgi:hypothetical protein